MQRVYWKIVLGIVIAGFTANLIMNIVIDPYKVFGIFDFNRKNFEVNSRYLKTEYLRKHHDYDAFIFGTSRAQAYAVDTLEKLTGQKTYNFCVPGENMNGILQKIRWLVADGHGIKRAVICLDYDFMFTAEDIEPFDLLRQEHPLVSGEPGFGFYARYLMFQPTVIRKTVIANLSNNQVRYRFDRETGRDIFFERSDKIHVKKQLIADNVALPKMNTYARPQQMAAFHATVNLLKEKGIESLYIVNPCHHLLLMSYDMQDYKDWLAGLAAAGAPVWDFSGFNSITMDDGNYSDISHFNSQIGDVVLQCALGNGRNDGPGVVLLQETLHERLESIQLQYEDIVGKTATRSSAEGYN